MSYSLLLRQGKQVIIYPTLQLVIGMKRACMLTFLQKLTQIEIMKTCTMHGFSWFDTMQTMIYSHVEQFKNPKIHLLCYFACTSNTCNNRLQTSCNQRLNLYNENKKKPDGNGLNNHKAVSILKNN